MKIIMHFYNFKMKTNFIKIICFALLLIQAIFAEAQGNASKKVGHIKANLDFFNNYGGIPGAIQNPLPLNNGFYDATGWVIQDGIKMKGLVAGAVLKIHWWTLVSEPIQDNQFIWKSSGEYDIAYTNKKGQPVTAHISKANLSKYPDLLLRFENIAPQNVDFTVKWSLGSISDKDYELYKKKYGIVGTIGKAHPHVNKTFISTFNGSQLIFDTSEKEPYHTPAATGGGWTEFLGLGASYDQTNLAHIREFYDYTTNIVIKDFKIKAIKWPIQELKNIAEKYVQYEKGETEPTPKELIEAENKKSLPQYKGDKYWAEPDYSINDGAYTESKANNNDNFVILTDKSSGKEIGKYYKSKFFIESSYGNFKKKTIEGYNIYTKYDNRNEKLLCVNNKIVKTLTHKEHVILIIHENNYYFGIKENTISWPYGGPCKITYNNGVENIQTVQQDIYTALDSRGKIKDVKFLILKCAITTYSLEYMEYLKLTDADRRREDQNNDSYSKLIWQANCLLEQIDKKFILLDSEVKWANYQAAE
jgi:hypothetical protein